jgi:hypothetical protein
MTLEHDFDCIGMEKSVKEVYGGLSTKTQIGWFRHKVSSGSVLLIILIKDDNLESRGHDCIARMMNWGFIAKPLGRF